MLDQGVIPDGAAIERARKTRSLTLKSLAEQCGLGVRLIQQAEASRRLEPTVLQAIATALDRPLDDLLSVAEHNKRIEQMMAEGEFVGTRWTNFGTQKGDLTSYAPSGRRVETVGMSLARIVDGRVKEAWQCWNFTGMLETIGAAPPLEKIMPQGAAQNESHSG
jgi:transcriptional regulator with XRE-family HTH domain